MQGTVYTPVAAAEQIVPQIPTEETMQGDN